MPYIAQNEYLTSKVIVHLQYKAYLRKNRKHYCAIKYVQCAVYVIHVNVSHLLKQLIKIYLWKNARREHFQNLNVYLPN